jgi:hypothetical protein
VPTWIYLANVVCGLVRRYLWDDEPVSRAVIEAVIARSIRAFSEGSVGLFGVRWRGGEDLLGFCGLVRVEGMDGVFTR